MLEVKNINAFYGKTQALYDVSLTVNEGEIVALIGSNGAGKTTTLNAISGLLRPASGSVEFMGSRLTGLKTFSIVERGISHIPEGRRPFPDMSVRENLEMGAYLPRVWKNKNQALDQIFETFPVLHKKQNYLARTLSGGEQQMLVMGRGMMSNPKLCMIDEPSSGLAPILIAEIFRIVKSLRDQGMTILLIEQNVRHSLEIADRGYVIENGRMILKGKGQDLLGDETIKKAYLGL
ncbi:MAG: ABC transporter ATP-binding protein [Desulfarculaceae bacterium]|nr:ABC transporter ATP-binding protein [Desulfarculaceae bacterium]